MTVMRFLMIGLMCIGLAACANNASLDGGASENGGSASGRIGSIFRF